MRKFLVLFIILFIGISVCAETLNGGVSQIDRLPKSFYGSWRVVAKVDKQKGEMNFHPQVYTIWNLSRVGDVINLSNPFNGASATIKVDYVDGNIIRFTKNGNYDSNRILTDTVDLKLNGDTFTGINSIKLETFSTYDNSLLKTDEAIYILRGEKISGTSITGEN
jgi:hypothetical protein